MPVEVYRFGDFSLHCGKFELCRKGRRLKLERKPLELLVLLVTKHGQVVTREEIAQRLWEREVFVDIEHGINTAVRKIRQSLGDSSDMPQFVQTVSGSGYRFIATTTAAEPEITESAPVTVDPVQAPGASPKIPPTSSVPTAKKPPRRLWLVTALFVSLLVAVSVLTLGPHPLAARFLNRHTHAAVGSIAVLPLQNLSGDPNQEYFADGMTDELITELARIPDLRVVSRTSVMAEKNNGRSLPDIARQFDVDAIVEGSIVRSGDRIRITAQLIDAHADRHLWAQSFEGSASDVLSIQDSVAQQIAIQARHVLVASTPRPPVIPAAYDAYLRGRYFFNKQDFARSLEYFKQAVVLDPGYASAHAGYANALEAATTYYLGTPEQFMPQALAEAQRAIQLDPQNSEAYTELGSVETTYEWNWIAAERNLARGISLDPNDSIAEFKYAIYLEGVGLSRDAVSHMRNALKLDPLSFLINRRLGIALYFDRQYDAALAQLKLADEMEPQSGTVEYYVSLIYEQKEDRDEAVRHNLIGVHENQPHLDTAALLSTYQQHGWQSYWRARSRTILAAPANSCTAYEIGLNDIRANELGPAFDSLQQALDNHCWQVIFIRVHPLLDSVRQDPRYAALLNRMHQ